MPQALYRKWRPQTWEQVIGQEPIIQTLRNALSSGRIVHAYLFAGPRGTGKTTTARILAKAVNCLVEDLAARPCNHCEYCTAVNTGRFLDLIEIDAASNTSVDDVRDLRDKINFTPNQGRYKVYIIDEVHMLSTAAFNALLKTLEEPPPHAIFVLATTEVHKIPATVLSRCQRHEFRRIPIDEIVAQLEIMARDEHIQAEPEALTLIARQSTGAMRDAISLLDQLASSGEKITLELAQAVLGTATSQAVLDLIGALIARHAATGLDIIHKTLDKGSDPRQFARQIVDYLRGLLLTQTQNADQVEATIEIKELMQQHARAFSTGELLLVLQAFNRAANEGRTSWHPSLPLELAYIESMQLSSGSSPSAAPAKAASAEKTTSPTTSTPPASLTSPATPLMTAQRAPANKAEAIPGETNVLKETPAEPTPQDWQATQKLSEAWMQILSLVRRANPSAYGLLNSCKSRYIKGNELVLSFASEVLKAKMEKKENTDAVYQVLGQVFQREMHIRCNVDLAKRDVIPPGVEENGMVATALRDLGGEIVDVQ